MSDQNDVAAALDVVRTACGERGRLSADLASANARCGALRRERDDREAQFKEAFEIARQALDLLGCPTGGLASLNDLSEALQKAKDHATKVADQKAEAERMRETDCSRCNSGVISRAHGKCTSCNANFLDALPKTPAYDDLRSLLAQKCDAFDPLAEAKEKFPIGSTVRSRTGVVFRVSDHVLAANRELGAVLKPGNALAQNCTRVDVLDPLTPSLKVGDTIFVDTGAMSPAWALCRVQMTAINIEKRHFMLASGLLVLVTDEGKTWRRSQPVEPLCGEDCSACFLSKPCVHSRTPHQQHFCKDHS